MKGIWKRDMSCLLLCMTLGNMYGECVYGNREI